MVPPSARFPTRRAALAEEAARRALAGLGPELVLPQLRAQTVQELRPAGRCGVRIMRHAANTDRSTDPMCAPPPRLAVRHVPVGDHLPCSSAPGAGAGRPSWKPCALFWPAAGRRCWK